MSSSTAESDSIADAREQAVGEDPTIHDYRPPEITVTYANFNDTTTSANYRLIYTVEDPSGVDRTALLKEDGELRYDDDVDVEDIVDLSDSVGLSDATAFIKPRQPIEINRKTVDTVVLNRGDDGAGIIHFRNRHIDGNSRQNSDGITSIWPLGQTVGSQKISPVLSRVEDVDELVYRGIKRGDSEEDAGNIVFRHDIDDKPGINTICVKVNLDGKVQSAYPEGTGSKVDTYFGGVDQWNIATPSGC